MTEKIVIIQKMAGKSVKFEKKLSREKRQNWQNVGKTVTINKMAQKPVRTKNMV